MITAKQNQLTALQAQQAQAIPPVDLLVTIATLENEIAHFQLKQAEPVEVKMLAEESALYQNQWRTY
jgi:hypothetical protein